MVSARCARSVCRLVARAACGGGAPLPTPPGGCGGGIIGIRGSRLGGGIIVCWPILHSGAGGEERDAADQTPTPDTRSQRSELLTVQYKRQPFHPFWGQFTWLTNTLTVLLNQSGFKPSHTTQLRQ